MAKKINFLYNTGGMYTNVLDSLIDPILEYLPDAAKSSKFLEGQINISFFRETLPQRGIFMSHGLADKNWRDAGKVGGFDYICVSGPLWKEKMIRQGLPEYKILINGYTKLDLLFQDNERVRNNDGKIHVLHAPTHNIIDKAERHVSSYSELKIYSAGVPQDIELIESFHPANNNSKITLDHFKSADVVISDCSSVLYEAWSLGIPVVFPDWLVKESIISQFPGSFEEKIYVERIGYHARNPEEIWELIREAKVNGMDSITRDFIEGIFPSTLRGNSGRVTAELLLKLAES